jgi:hypothetical protein
MSLSIEFEIEKLHSESCNNCILIKMELETIFCNITAEHLYFTENMSEDILNQDLIRISSIKSQCISELSKDIFS